VTVQNEDVFEDARVEAGLEFTVIGPLAFKLVAKAGEGGCFEADGARVFCVSEVDED
jgi:hypothetical protein